MDALAFLVPAVATAALGGALLVPIRDGRAGRKATVDGPSPLLADFRNVRITNVSEDDLGAERLAETVPEPEEMPVPVALPSPFDPMALVRSVAKRLGSQRSAFDEPEHEIVTERSFADELSSLLPVSVAEVATPVPNTFAPLVPENFPEISQPSVVEVCQHDTDAIAAHAPRMRFVPITRLPLRRQTSDITWPASASPPLVFATEAQRYAFLRAAATDSGRADDALLARAFREETAEGRALALVALRRPDASREAIDAFTDALCMGSDDERALAVDALSEAGAREQVARGITDRIDAIAARAALAYVGTSARDDYRVALSPLIDESRIETILALLAGVVE